MKIVLPYLNSRSYVHGSTFVKQVFSNVTVANSMEIFFHKISLPSVYDLRIGHKPFDKRDYNVTGRVDDTIYFGFRETDDTGHVLLTADEYPVLTNVTPVSLAWTCSTYLRNQSSCFYNNTQQLLLGSLKFRNLSSLKDLFNLTCDQNIRNPLVRGTFYVEGLEVCRVVGLIRNKDE